MPNRREFEREALALRFVNSYADTRGRVLDRLADPVEVVAWLEEHLGPEIVPWGRAGPPPPPMARTLHREALALRAAIRDLFASHAGRTDADAVTLHVLDRALRSCRWGYAVGIDSAGPRPVRTPLVQGPLGMLGPVALSALDTVGEVPRGRLRRCAADGCPFWFVDTSKGGRRRWCSMTRCGNRRKAARHRRRRSEPV